MDGTELGQEHAGKPDHGLAVAEQADQRLRDVTVGDDHLYDGNCCRDGRIGRLYQLGWQRGIPKTSEGIGVEVQLSKTVMEVSSLPREPAKILLLL